MFVSPSLKLEPFRFYLRRDDQVIQTWPRRVGHQTVYTLEACTAKWPFTFVSYLSERGTSVSPGFGENIVATCDPEDPQFIVPIGTRVHVDAEYGTKPAVAAASFNHQAGGVVYTLTNGLVLPRRKFLPDELPSKSSMILVSNYLALHGGKND